MMLGFRVRGLGFRDIYFSLKGFFAVSFQGRDSRTLP